MHRIIHFNQKASLKPFIDTEHISKKKTENDCEKCFFKLMNNAVFRKTIEM